MLDYPEYVVKNKDLYELIKQLEIMAILLNCNIRSNERILTHTKLRIYEITVTRFNKSFYFHNLSVFYDLDSNEIIATDYCIINAIGTGERNKTLEFKSHILGSFTKPIEIFLQKLGEEDKIRWR